MSSSESEGEDNLEEEEVEEEGEKVEADLPAQSKKTFAELGLSDVLVEAAEKVSRWPGALYETTWVITAEFDVIFLVK